MDQLSTSSIIFAQWLFQLSTATHVTNTGSSFENRS
jgi:hypothetical protein